MASLLSLISSRSVIAFVLLLLSVLYTNTNTTIAVEGTIIESDIVGNVTWTKDRSPYIIITSIAINGTLIIEPGTTVVFANGISLKIRGSIIANGSENDPIVFKLVNPEGETNFIVLEMYGGTLMLKSTEVSIPYLFLSGRATSGIPSWVLVTGKFIFINSRINNMILRWTTHLITDSLIVFNDTFVRGGFGTGGLLGIIYPMEIYNSNIVIDKSILINGIDIKGHGVNMTITGSFLRGLSLYLDSGSRVSINSSSIAFGSINLGGDRTSEIVARSCIIYGNSPVYIDRADVRYNWWGDSSGPMISELNPKGKGQRIDRISLDQTKIYPWLEKPPLPMPSYKVEIEPPIPISEYPAKISIVAEGVETMFGYFMLDPRYVVITSNLSVIHRYSCPGFGSNVCAFDAIVFALTKDRVPIGERLKVFVIPPVKPKLRVLINNMIYPGEGSVVYLQTRNITIGVGFSELPIVVDDPVWSKFYEWLYNNASVDVLINNTRAKVNIAADMYKYGYGYIVNGSLNDGVYEINVSVKNFFGEFQGRWIIVVDTSPPKVVEFELVDVDMRSRKAVFKVKVYDLTEVHMFVYDNNGSVSYGIRGEYVEVPLLAPGNVHNITFMFVDRLGQSTSVSKIIDLLSLTTPFTRTAETTNTSIGRTTMVNTTTPQIMSTPISTLTTISPERRETFSGETIALIIIAIIAIVTPTVFFIMRTILRRMS